jgi:CheY-like chemotaxis protein
MRFVGKDHLPSTDPSGSTPTLKRPAKQGRAAGRRRSAILIVGDQSDALVRCARTLAAYGYGVDFAHDEAALARLGREEAALARLGREKEFDVVLNDIDMRNCCEGESLRKLRKENRRVPVVVLSGCLAFASARAALDCGAYKYLVKPVSDERLLEVLVEAIQETATRQH